jgi:hypothetical protein
MGLPFKDEKTEIHFCPIIPDFRRCTAFCKVPRLRPFALLVRATFNPSCADDGSVNEYVCVCMYVTSG